MVDRPARSRRQSKLKWELDVRPLISSRAWLKNYGLKKNKLTMHQLLPTIGFKLSDDYDTNLKRPVASRYGGSLFMRAFRKDGNTYNLKCSKDKLVQIKNRLSQVINLFDRRLSWLTSESRRTFGVIEEKSVTVVLDIKNISPQQFNQFFGAFQLVLQEQISQISKFNLIRSAEDMKLFREQCVPVTHDTLYEASQWIKDCDRLAPVSSTAGCEAVLKALEDKSNEAVFFLTEGSTIDSCRGVFLERLSSANPSIPVHIVSYNCDNIDTIHYLKDLAKCTNARFHAYAVTMEMVTYDAEGVDSGGSSLVLKKNMYGGMPEGAGIREDVLILFEEFEEARNTQAFIEQLIKDSNWDVPKEEDDKAKGRRRGKNGNIVVRKESSMGSAEWLRRYGLEINKLEFCDALSKVTFDHVEGVTNVYHSATCHDKKLVDAVYCESLFPAVNWSDGTIKHVIVTPGIHRNYEQRITVALNKIQERINWLKKGSRAVFGTIIEDSIYIIIDCSASMEPNIQFVKEKLYRLIHEQLRHKKRFNIISFGSTVEAWSSRLVDIKPHSLQSAWNWIQALTCSGSTNTHAALQYAMADPMADAIYLLTDGCPDQPPKSIIAQVLHQNKLPVHTIAFNCNNRDGNQFLYELACNTGGRFHHFSEYYMDESQPQPWISEDLKLLQNEYNRGMENLKRIAKLRDQCQTACWESGIKELQQNKNKHPQDRTCVHSSRIVKTCTNTFPFTPFTRPTSAPPQLKYHPKPPKRSVTIKRKKSKVAKSRQSKVAFSNSKSVSDSVNGEESVNVSDSANVSNSVNVSDSANVINSITESQNVSNFESVPKETDPVSNSTNILDSTNLLQGEQ